MNNLFAAIVVIGLAILFFVGIVALVALPITWALNVVSTGTGGGPVDYQVAFAGTLIVALLSLFFRGGSSK